MFNPLSVAGLMAAILVMAGFFAERGYLDVWVVGVVAACGALIACSYRDLAALGLLNLVAVPVLMWLTVSGFFSLWCFWAAMVSVVIAFHVRRSARRREPQVSGVLHVT